MYHPENESFAVVYIEGHSLGVSIFNQQDLSINCGQIVHFCFPDQQLLLGKLSQCSRILTNQPKSTVLSLLESRLQDFKAEVRNESIFHLLNEMPFENMNVANKQAYFNMMLEESSIKFKAFGMLLYHLINFTVIFKRCKIPFSSINYWSDYIFHHVQVTQAEINYLQITAEHLHPSLVKANVHNTLGSSILKIYDSFLRTKGAKKYLKRLMLNPTYDKLQLQQRQYTIKWMIKHMNDKNLYSKYFRNIYTLDAIMFRFQRDRVEEEDWRKLIKSLESMIQLRKCLPLVNNPPQIVRRLLDKEYWGKLTYVLGQLNKVIELAPLFGIKQGYDCRLKQLKNLHFQMPKILAQISRTQNWSTTTTNARLIFMPQIGYLVQIPHSHNNIQQPPQWQLKFTNTNGNFYSTQLSRQLDDEYGDVSAAIRDIETRILDQLEEGVVEIVDEVVDVYWAVSGVECLWGVSQLGRNMAAPKYSSQQFIVINSWSMLLGQHAVDNHGFSFHHPNGPSHKVFNSQLNIVNTNYSNRLSLISGPNGAGKTIYMKQLGTMVYLAHCGFNVPASMVEMPLVDRIVVVQSASSLYSTESGFERQLVALSKIMNTSTIYLLYQSKDVLTNKCLVLIDEIGLSHDYTIGLKVNTFDQQTIKMLYACVKYLSAGNNTSNRRFRVNKVLESSHTINDHFNVPWTIIITHLTQLMANQLIEEGYYVRYLTMDVNNDFDFLFKLKPGLVKSGYGIKSAQGFIRSESIIERAYHLWNKIK